MRSQDVYPAVPNHPQTTKFSANSGFEYFTSQGMPTWKITVGVPLYGHAFPNTVGLGHSFSHNAEATEPLYMISIDSLTHSWSIV